MMKYKLNDNIYYNDKNLLIDNYNTENINDINNPLDYRTISTKLKNKLKNLLKE